MDNTAVRLTYLESDAPLDYETSVRLKELGFPQDNWPQMVWLDWGPTLQYFNGSPFRLRPHIRLADAQDKSTKWVAAPTPLTALAWFEEVEGWWFSRGLLLNYSKTWWRAVCKQTRQGVEADTPSDLVRKIVEAMKEVADATH